MECLCEADIFEIHGDVYPRHNPVYDTSARDDVEVVYPDIDPRGSRMRPSLETPTVGPALLSDPANPLNRTPELITSQGSVSPAVFDAYRSAVRNQAIAGQSKTGGTR